jgi:glycosidase
MPGGSGWHYHPDRDQYYYASFLHFQPDLNFRNPEVKQEMFNVAKFWLEKGVDGFRLDIFHAIYKAEHFKDNPTHWAFIPSENKFGFFTEWKYTVNQPETIALAHEFRSFMNSYQPTRFMVGEIYCDDQTLKNYLGDTTDGMHSIFLWEMMNFDFKADFFWQALNHYETWYPPPYLPVLVLGNHDSKRWIDRLKGDTQKAKLIALLQLTARGIPVVYYGEEIGLPEGKFPVKTALDPVGQRFSWAPNWLLNLLNLYVNRDNCRTPMAWDATQHAGFSKGDQELWLPLSAEPSSVNVEAQSVDPNSLLNWYRKLLDYRKSSTALLHGSLNLMSKELAKKGLLGYVRQAEGARYGILLNMSSQAINVDLPGSEIEIQTGQIDLGQNKVHVGPYAGCIVKLSE